MKQTVEARSASGILTLNQSSFDDVLSSGTSASCCHFDDWSWLIPSFAKPLVSGEEFFGGLPQRQCGNSGPYRPLFLACLRAAHSRRGRTPAGDQGA